MNRRYILLILYISEHPVTSTVNPVIESPEDLEKWLDDFLDS